MTQEQRDKLHRELSDLKGRKVFNRTETWLSYSENRCIPIEEVKRNYEHYLKYGCSVTARSLGISNKTLLDRFKFYGFKKVGIWGKREPSDKIKDTLNLTQKDWNTKYNTTSGSYYYNCKNKMLKYLENQDTEE